MSNDQDLIIDLKNGALEKVSHDGKLYHNVDKLVIKPPKIKNFKKAQKLKSALRGVMASAMQKIGELKAIEEAANSVKKSDAPKEAEDGSFVKPFLDMGLVDEAVEERLYDTFESLVLPHFCYLQHEGGETKVSTTLWEEIDPDDRENIILKFYDFFIQPRLDTSPT